jgi:hypothetical protein
MAKRKSIYSRLTGRKRTLGGYSQLWLGPDHILLVHNRRLSEHYQRFSLADIQAIVLTERPENSTQQIAALAGVILSGLGVVAFSSIFAKVFAAFFGMAAVGVLFNRMVWGARCDCHLHTAVSRELLRPVSRMPGARDFLQRVGPAIEAVQGSLSGEQAAKLEFSAAPFEKPPEVVRAPGFLPEVLFLLFLMDAVLVLANMRFPQAQLSSILLTTIFGEIVILIVALLRRAGRDPRRVVYGLIIAAIFCLGWDVGHVAGSLFGWANGVVAAGTRGGAPPSLVTWVALGPRDTMFAAAWRIAAGAIGLSAAWLERRP